MQTVLSRPPNTHGGVDRHNHSATVSMIHGIPELRISRKVSCTREGGGVEEEGEGGRGGGGRGGKRRRRGWGKRKRRERGEEEEEGEGGRGGGGRGGRGGGRGGEEEEREGWVLILQLI